MRVQPEVWGSGKVGRVAAEQMRALGSGGKARRPACLDFRECDDQSGMSLEKP